MLCDEEKRVRENQWIEDDQSIGSERYVIGTILLGPSDFFYGRKVYVLESIVSREKQFCFGKVSSERNTRRAKEAEKGEINSHSFDSENKLQKMYFAVKSCVKTKIK